MSFNWLTQSINKDVSKINKYTHLNIQKRILLALLLKQGHSKAAIAKELKVHRSTIYREINRNHDSQFGYHILIAEEKARKRQQDQKLRKLERRPHLKAFVIEKLQLGWSPQQIVGRMKLMGGKTITSHEAIYAYIYSPEGMKTKLYQYLYSKRSRRYPKYVRKKRTLIPNRVCITQRPEFINNRSEFGHWEVDFMHFKKHTASSFITLRERQSRYLIAIKQPYRTAHGVMTRMVTTLEKSYKSCFKSFTFDNDVGFCQHEKIADFFQAKTYFCEPYKSYQKGSIENGNRQLRSYFPKTLDPTPLEQSTIDTLVNQLNYKPMKCLGYYTPYEIFYNQTKL